MNIVLLGLNNKTAPIELRERLAIGRSNWRRLRARWCSPQGCWRG